MSRRNTGIPEEIYEPQYDYDIDYDDSGIDESLLTNFEVSERPLYEKAIKEYESKFPEKRGNIYISDLAYTVWGSLLKDHNSLHVYYNMDCTDFWNIKKSLEGEKK